MCGSQYCIYWNRKLDLPTNDPHPPTWSITISNIPVATLVYRTEVLGRVENQSVKNNVRYSATFFKI